MRRKMTLVLLLVLGHTFALAASPQACYLDGFALVDQLKTANSLGQAAAAAYRVLPLQFLAGCYLQPNKGRCFFPEWFKGYKDHEATVQLLSGLESSAKLILAQLKNASNTVFDQVAKDCNSTMIIAEIYSRERLRIALELQNAQSKWSNVFPFVGDILVDPFQVWNAVMEYAMYVQELLG